MNRNSRFALYAIGLAALALAAPAEAASRRDDATRSSLVAPLSAPAIALPATTDASLMIATEFSSQRARRAKRMRRPAIRYRRVYEAAPAYVYPRPYGYAPYYGPRYWAPPYPVLPFFPWF